MTCSLSSRNTIVGYHKQVGDPETKIKIRFSRNVKWIFVVASSSIIHWLINLPNKSVFQQLGDILMKRSRNIVRALWREGVMAIASFIQGARKKRNDV